MPRNRAVHRYFEQKLLTILEKRGQVDTVLELSELLGCGWQTALGIAKELADQDKIVLQRQGMHWEISRIKEDQDGQN